MSDVMKRAIIETMLSIYALKEQVLRLFILCKIKPMLSFVNQKQFAFYELQASTNIAQIIF